MSSKKKKHLPAKQFDGVEVINFYDVMPQKYKKNEIHYPTEHLYKIKLPCQMLITGRTGSGKTNILVNLYKKIGVFTKVVLCAKDTTESLYAYLIDVIREVEKDMKKDMLTVCNTLEGLPSVDTMSDKDITLVIFDDQITESAVDLRRAEEYAIRGRKKGCSTVFITQSFFDAPAKSRKQTGYWIFTEIASDTDLSNIARNFRVGLTKEQLIKMYNDANKDGFPHFFMIDRVASEKDKKWRYRRDFVPMEVPSPMEAEAWLERNTGEEGENSRHEEDDSEKLKSKIPIKKKRKNESDSEHDHESEEDSDEEREYKKQKKSVSLKHVAEEIKELSGIVLSEIRKQAKKLKVPVLEFAVELLRNLKANQ